MNAQQIYQVRAWAALRLQREGQTMATIAKVFRVGKEAARALVARARGLERAADRK